MATTEPNVKETVQTPINIAEENQPKTTMSQKTGQNNSESRVKNQVASAPELATQKNVTHDVIAEE